MTDKTIQNRKFKSYLVIGLVTFSVAVITAVIGLGTMLIIGFTLYIIGQYITNKNAPKKVANTFQSTERVDQPKKRVFRKNREPQYNEQGGQINSERGESLAGFYIAIIFIIAVVIWTIAQNQ